MMIEQIIW